MGIKSFANSGSRDIGEGINTKAARGVLPKQLHPKAAILCAVIAAARKLEDLSLSRSWCLERLKGDRSGQHSIRINNQYRICFLWTGQDAEDVEIVDYH